MRREGYEFAVSKPEVLYKRDDNNKLLEPMEHVIVDVSQAQIGTVIELLGRRKAEMLNMTPSGDMVRAEFIVPARGLIGFRTEFLTSTRGEGIIHHTFHGYDAHKGDFATRTRGSLISMEAGPSTAYALEMVQERGILFLGPGVDIYEGMVVGENSREDDMVVNPCRTKHLTNMRASGSDGTVRLDTPRQLSLEQYIEFISDDELLEVTPQNIRIRKRFLNATDRARMKKRSSLAVAEEA
jgi:GTP-binding protein